MKRNFKRMTALLLTLIMAFSLCACGSSSGTAANNGASGTAAEEQPAYVYSTDFVTLGDEMEYSMSPRLFASNGFYAISYEKIGEREHPDDVAEYEGEYDIYGPKLYFVDFSGSVSELVNYNAPTLAEDNSDKQDYYSGGDVSGIGITADNKLVVIENVYESWFDGPADLSREDDSYWEYQNYRSNWFIRTLDQNGSELSSAQIEVGENESFNPYNSIVDDKGRFVVATDNGVRIIGTDGADAMKITDDEAESGNAYIQSVCRLGDGRLAASVWANEDGNQLWIIDEDSKSFGEKLSLPNDAYNIYTGGGDYGAYYTSGVNFYGIDLATGESTRLFNWINCDINGDDVNKFLIRDDGSIVCVINEYDQNDEVYALTLATISLVPYDSVPHKETITLATQYLDWNVRNTVIDFNRKNEQYRIEVEDYFQYNTDEDYSAGLTKLTTELLAGNVPDIIDLNGLPYTQLAAKGLLEDLYPYIDADPGFDREDIFPNVLKALEVNGGMYSTCSSFYLITAIGAASVVGDEPGWTYDEFNAALASMPEGCEPFDTYTTRDSILSTCLNLDMNNFVNWSTGECNFNSKEFIDLLEFAAQFPESFDWESYEYTPEESTENRIAQGKQMLMQGSIFSISDIFYNDMYFGGDATYIGFPTSDGRPGSLIGKNSGFAMSASSAHKDVVWQFLRDSFTEKGQSDVYPIPTNINAYNALVKEAMTPQYKKDANGNFILDEDGNRIEVSRGGFGTATGQTVEFYSLSQEQADELWIALTSATAVNDYYENSIFGIVKEQSQAFFAGQKSAEDVAKLVQSKANIYVNEQR